MRGLITGHSPLQGRDRRHWFDRPGLRRLKALGATRFEAPDGWHDLRRAAWPATRVSPHPHHPDPLCRPQQAVGRSARDQTL